MSTLGGPAFFESPAAGPHTSIGFDPMMANADPPAPAPAPAPEPPPAPAVRVVMADGGTVEFDAATFAVEPSTGALLVRRAATPYGDVVGAFAAAAWVRAEVVDPPEPDPMPEVEHDLDDPPDPAPAA